MNRARGWLMLGAVGGFLRVALGAFGAHALKTSIEVERLANWDTAADYLGFHALALLACGLLLLHRPRAGLIRGAAWVFLIGTLLFSGSLFLLVLTGERQLGLITPIGGVLLLVGWLLLALGAWRIKTDQG